MRAPERPPYPPNALSAPAEPGRSPKFGEAGYSLAELLIVVAITGFLMAAVFTIYQVTQSTSLRASGSEAALVQARAVVDKFGGDFRMVGAAWNLYSSSITAATGTSITFNGDIDNTLDASYNPVVLTAAIANSPSSFTVSDTTSIVCGTQITLANGPISEMHALPASGCTSGNTVNLMSGDTIAQGYPAGTSPFSALWASATSLDVTFIYTVESINWVWDSGTQKLCRKINGTCPGNPNDWNDDTDIIADNVTNFCLTYLDYTGNTLNSSCGALNSGAATRDIRAAIITVTVNSRMGDQTITRQMELTARSRTLIP
jgi:Tfp pilus assembly protein PilE